MLYYIPPEHRARLASRCKRMGQATDPYQGVRGNRPPVPACVLAGGREGENYFIVVLSDRTLEIRQNVSREAVEQPLG